MFNIFQNKKTSKEIANKNMLSKELFNSSTKKKIITQAARDSAEDQRRLLADYERILKSESTCVSQ
jgi:hypothetical protein